MWSMLGMLIVPPAMAYGAGGWALVTVDDVPEYLVAGKPTEIGFTVRQHGATPLNGLQARIDGRRWLKHTTAPGKATGGAGHYVASVVVPEPGEWTLTVESGFGPSKSVLLPIPVIAAGAAAPAPLRPAERGAQLFVAKGCVGCHVHGMVDRPTLVTIGPELTSRRYPAEFLSKLLADPASVQGTRPGGFKMPNLGLRPAEIQSLVAFINDGGAAIGRDPSRTRP
jgi:hypothetical protein